LHRPVIPLTAAGVLAVLALFPVVLVSPLRWRKSRSNNRSSSISPSIDGTGAGIGVLAATGEHVAQRTPPASRPKNALLRPRLFDAVLADARPTRAPKGFDTTCYVLHSPKRVAH
jgi:hypothetical protein